MYQIYVSWCCLQQRFMPQLQVDHWQSLFQPIGCDERIDILRYMSFLCRIHEG